MPQLTTSGSTNTNTNTTATSTGTQTQVLEDVFVALASALTGSSAGGSPLTSQGGQSSPTLSSSDIHTLADFAAALVEALEGSSQPGAAGSSGTTTTGGSTGGATSSTSQSNPAAGTGNNSNTSPTFSLNLAPPTSANAMQATQVGVDAINNMPSSTLANVNINAYTNAAQTAMTKAGYSQDQISAYMTGLYKEYGARTTPVGGSTSSSGGTQTQNHTTYQPQQPLQLNNTQSS